MKSKVLQLLTPALIVMLWAATAAGQSQTDLAAKVRDPEKREAVIHRNTLEAQVIDWTGGRDAGNRKAELEGHNPEPIQAGAASDGGYGESDAYEDDADGEDGGGAESQAFPLEPLNSEPFFD